MDITNSLASTTIARSAQEGRHARASQEGRVELLGHSSSGRAGNFNADELVRRGAELEGSRVQRLDNADSAPFRARQALDTYQQTLSAAQQFEQGELVGVDLFI